MGAVSYTIKAFDPEEAASGALCIVLNGNTIGGSAISFTGETPNNTVTEESLIGSESNSGKVLLGTGICKRRGDLFTITINSTNYTFNSDGTGYSGTARGKHLYRCEVVDTTTVTNNVVSTTKKITRGDNGTISTTTIEPANILVENLTARDEFAAQALRGILGRIDNPSVLSKDELKFYCDAAYKWAEGMLQEAAKSRAVGSITTVSGTSTSSYSDNTEALLAKIATAIGNISISGGSGGSIDTATLVAVLDKMLYTIKSEGRWHYHTAIDKNDSGQFKFVYRPIYGRAQVKLEYYDSDGNLLPESTVTNWSGKRYTNLDAEIQDGGDLTKTYSQLIDMIMTDSAVADSEGYYYKATPQYPTGSNVTVASVKVFVDVNSINVSGGSASTDREVSFASGASVGVSGSIYTPDVMSASSWRLWAYVSIDGNSMFQFVFNSIYSKSKIKIEYYDSNGARIPENHVDVWKGRLYHSDGTVYSGTAGNPKTLDCNTLVESLISNAETRENDYLLMAPFIYSESESTYVSVDEVASVKIWIDVISLPGSVDIGAITSIPTVTTKLDGSNSALGSSSNPFYVSMPGYLPLSDVGVQNGKVLRLVEFPNFGSIKDNGNCNQNYIPNTDANTDTQAYFMGLTRWVMINYHDSGMVTLMGSANPNSCGTAIFNLYSDSGYGQSGVTGADTTMPLHCSGVYFAYSGLIISFGTRDGVWYYREIDTSYIMAATASVADKAWQLRGANRSGSDSPPSTYMPSSNSGELAYVYSELALAGGAVSNRNEQRVTFAPWQDYNGGFPVQLSFVGDNGYSGFGGMFIRAASGISTWGSWEQIATSSNSFVKVGGKLLENITFSGVDDVVNGLVFYYGNTNIGKFGVTKNGNNYYLSWTPNSGTAKKVLFEGDAPSFSFYASTSGGESINMNNTNGLSMKVRSVSSGVYALDYLPLSGGTVNALNAKTIGVLNSDDTNRVYIQWDNNGYLNIKGDNNTPPRGYSFDAPVTQSSDIRLKDVISHEVLGVNEIAEMPLVKFSWKEDKEKKVHFGTIAQDWEKTIPEVISEGPDGMKAMDYGAAAMAAGVTACREIVALKEENKELKKTVEYLKKELEAIKEIVYGKKENDMED